MPKPITKVTGIALSFMFGVIIGAGGLWLTIQSNMNLRHYALEQPVADGPQAQVTAFTQALARDDYAAARALWEIKNEASQPALVERRNQVLATLEAADIREIMFRRTEWWSTCCEPGVTCDVLGAGGARVSVQFIDKNGESLPYTVDVFTREQPYWGAAAGYPPREWVIRDIYTHEQSPLFWSLISKQHVQHAEP